MSDIIVYIGKRGAGKTTAMRARMEGESRIIAHDPMGQFGDLLPSSRSRQGFVDLIRLQEEEDTGIKAALFSGQEGDLEFACRAATIVAQRANLRDSDGTLLVLDEADFGLSAAAPSPSIRDAISYSRHYRLSILLGARRPASIPRLFTSQATEIICFRLTEPRDLKYVAEYCGSEFAEQVSQLGQYESLTWTEASG